MYNAQPQVDIEAGELKQHSPEQRRRTLLKRLTYLPSIYAGGFTHL
jgi:hypothetical protein